MKMEFSVYRQVLVNALGHMQSIIEKRNTLPILSNVKIEAAADLTLTATNVDLELVEHVAADVSVPGAITIPVQSFYDFVRKLPEDAEIKVNLSESGEFVVSSGRSVFRFQTMPADNFPSMVAPSATTKFTINTDDLARLVNQVKFAIPSDDVRYHLGGIYFHIDDSGRLAAVATDSQRLAFCGIPAPAGCSGMPAVILPRRLVAEISNLLGNVKVDDVSVELSDTKARFVIGNATLTSKLVDAQYPNYRIVIPKNNEKVATMNTKEFMHAIDLVSAAGSDKTKPVQMGFSMNKLVASVSSSADGNSVAGTEELDIEYNSDDKFLISFNLRYLLDIAGQVDADKMQLVMQDSLSPTLIKSSATDADSLFVLMPMRV